MRKKKRPPHAPRAGPSTAELPPQRARPWWPTAGAALLVIAGAVAAWGVLRSRRVVFPPPAPARPQPTVTYADFVGAEAGGACHAAKYAPRKHSTHSRAGRPPPPAGAIPPFNARPFQFRAA